MATYTELFGLTSDSALRNKVTVAVVIAAEVVRTEDLETPNHAARFAWANQALAGPAAMAKKLLWLLLAQNGSADVAMIQGASDAMIQAAVDAAVDLLAQ